MASLVRVGLDQPRDAVRNGDVGAEHAQAHRTLEGYAQAVDIQLASEAPELGDIADQRSEGIRQRTRDEAITIATMRRFVLRVLITAAAVLIANQLFQNLIVIKSDQPLVTVLVFAVILGVLNAFLRPILLLLTLPLNLLTLGLFTLVVNAIVFWLATVVQGGGVQVADFGAAFLGALVVTIVSFVASRVIT
jgi:putative membrane protein